MKRYFLSHSTLYKYSNSVIESTNRIYLYPYNDLQQQLVNFKLAVTGNPNIYTYLDEFNNRVGFFNYVPPHDYMLIKAQAEIIVKELRFPDEQTPISDQWQLLDQLTEDINYLPFLQAGQFFSSNNFKKILKDLKSHEDSVFSYAKKLCDYIHNNFSYQKGITNVFSTPEEIWNLKSGVCQDFTNVLIELFRASQIPSRYVSGYVYAKDGMVGAGATHAWAEVFIPNYGWLGLDPTNNCLAGEYHIRLAVGRNYNDCSPVKGVFKGNEKQHMQVKVLLDTSKKKDYLNLKFDDIKTSELSSDTTLSDNTYQKNLQIIQQQQQQQ